MNVFEFDKSLLERLQESENVLHCKDAAVPASEVRSEWCYHIELQIEPAGKLHLNIQIDDLSHHFIGNISI